MELLPGIAIDSTALYLPEAKTLILSDLHLGYEEERRSRGVLLPKGKQARLKEELARLLGRHEVKEVILAGDVKHEFSRISAEEWRDVQDLVEFIRAGGASVVVVGGNHDVLIAPILRRLDVPLLTAKLVGHGKNGIGEGKGKGKMREEKGKRREADRNILVVHGDKTIDELVKEGAIRQDGLKKVATIVMGHEHPALAITDGIRTETVKCFLLGDYRFSRRTAKLIVMPSSNPLVAGTDALRERPLGPLLDSFDGLSAFALLDERVLAFGRVELLRRRER